MACSLSLSHIYACIYITGGYKHISVSGCGLSCHFSVHTWQFLCVCPHVTIIAGVLALRETNGPQDNKTTLFHLHFSSCFLLAAFLSLFFVFSYLSLVPHSLSLPPPPADLICDLCPFCSLTFHIFPLLLIHLLSAFVFSYKHKCERICVSVGGLHYADIVYFPVRNVSPSGQISGKWTKLTVINW